MNRTIVLSLSLCAGLLGLFIGASPVLAGQHNKTRRTTKSSEPTSPVAGKEVRLTLTDGSQIGGKLVKLDMKEVIYENSIGDKNPVPIERVAIIAIGEPPKPQIDVKFIGDAETVVNAVSRVAAAVDAESDKGITYREYVQKVTEAKIAVETFIAKNSDHTEQQPFFVALRKVISSYDMASPIWSLRIGADQRRSLAEDAPEVQAVLAMYPDLKTTEYNNNGRYPTDKVVAWVWSKAAVQIWDLKSQVGKLKKTLNSAN